MARPKRTISQKKRDSEALEEIFAECYIHSHNSTKAAHQASIAVFGEPYKNDSSARNAGHVMKHKPHVADLIRRKRQEYLQSVDMDPASLLMELKKLATARLPEILRVSDDGESAYYDLSLIDETIAAALGEVTIETYTEGRGMNAREVKKIKVKLHDKMKATEMLMKHFGMFEKDNTQKGVDHMEAVQRARERIVREHIEDKRSAAVDISEVEASYVKK